jgi:hypothetical protein
MRMSTIVVSWRFKTLLAIFLGVLVYLSIREPILFALWVCVWLLSAVTNTFLGVINRPTIKLKYWLILFATIGLSFCMWEVQHAHAFFFTRLEEFFVNLANEAGSINGGGGGGSNFITNGIRIMFNLLRGSGMILAAVTVWRGYQQYSERQEWFPIVMPVFMGLLVVIVIEILSFMLLSGGQNSGGQT